MQTKHEQQHRVGDFPHPLPLLHSSPTNEPSHPSAPPYSTLLSSTPSNSPPRHASNCYKYTYTPISPLKTYHQNDYAKLFLCRVSKFTGDCIQSVTTSSSSRNKYSTITQLLAYILVRGGLHTYYLSTRYLGSRLRTFELVCNSLQWWNLTGLIVSPVLNVLSYFCFLFAVPAFSLTGLPILGFRPIFFFFLPSTLRFTVYSLGSVI